MKPLWTTERKIVAGFVTAVFVLCAVAGVAIWTTYALLRALDAAAQITLSTRTSALSPTTPPS